MINAKKYDKLRVERRKDGSKQPATCGEAVAHWRGCFRTSWNCLWAKGGGSMHKCLSLDNIVTYNLIPQAFPPSELTFVSLNHPQSNNLASARQPLQVSVFPSWLLEEPQVTKILMQTFHVGAQGRCDESGLGKLNAEYSQIMGNQDNYLNNRDLAKQEMSSNPLQGHHGPSVKVTSFGCLPYLEI